MQIKPDSLTYPARREKLGRCVLLNRPQTLQEWCTTRRTYHSEICPFCVASRGRSSPHLYRRRLRHALCPPSSRTPPLLGLAAVISLPSALQAPARGSRLLRLPRTPISLRLYSGLLCGAAFACLSGTVTLPANFAVRFLTGGVTTLFAALGGGGGGDRVLRHNAVRNIVCSAVSEFTSVSPELEKPGLLLPPQPPDPGDPGGSCPDPTPDQPPPCSASRRPTDVWVPVESRASLRPGTFRSPPFSVPHFSPLLSRLWLTFFTKSSPVRTPSRIPPPRFPLWEPPSARSSWRLAGEGGPTPCARLSRGFPPSRAPCAARQVTPQVTSAFELHSASAAPFHRENARAILRRSPDPVNGSYDLTGNLVSGSAW